MRQKIKDAVYQCIITLMHNSLVLENVARDWTPWCRNT